MLPIWVIRFLLILFVTFPVSTHGAECYLLEQVKARITAAKANEAREKPAAADYPLEKVVTLLTGRFDPLVGGALWQLMLRPDHGSFNALVAFMKSGDGDRSMAIDDLVVLGDSRAIPSIVAVLEERDNNPAVRWRAAMALECFKDTKSVPVLSKIVLNEKDDYLVTAAIDALGAIKDPNSLPSLLSPLGRTVAPANWNAAYAIGAIGGRTMVPELIWRVLDRNLDYLEVRTRWAAALALEIINDQEGNRAVSQLISEHELRTLSENYRDVVLRNLSDKAFPLILALERHGTQKMANVMSVSKLPDVVYASYLWAHYHGKTIEPEHEAAPAGNKQ